MSDQPKKKGINWNLELDFSSVNASDILFMTKHLAIAIKNGLTLIEGLEMLQEQATSKKFGRILGTILEILKTGNSFYDALAHYPKYFSAIYVNLVKTGELSGTLQENLFHLAEELKKSQDLKQKIKSAMMYPMIIFIAIMGLGFSVAVFVLPKIIPLFKTLNVELPLSTRGLIFIAEIFENHGLLIFVGGIAFVFLFFWLIRKNFVKPFTHRILLHIPVISPILKNMQLEQFSRTLGTLLKSGVTLDKGLQITSDAATNVIYRRAILSLIPEVEQGKPLSEAMARYPQLFPKIAMRMVGMGEKTGSLEETLKYLSEMYGEEVDNTVKNLSTIIEPAMLIIIGLVVGVVAVSILGPIYKITGAVQK